MKKWIKSMLRGAAYLFDFSGELHAQDTREILGIDVRDAFANGGADGWKGWEYDKAALERDAKAIDGDWEQVGKDMQEAIKKARKDM